MSVDLAQFKQKLIYQGNASLQELDSAINQLCEFDRSVEKTNRIVNWITGLSFLAGIGCLVGAFFELTWLVPFAVAAGVVFVVGLIYGSMSSKYDLQNRRYQLLQIVISLLSRDMPKDARFDVTLDLAPPNEKRKKVRSSQVGEWNVTHYHDPWLKLRGRLVDGTKFDIVMAERFQARKKWKRSRSGKSKLKTKSKSATVASVSLVPKQRNFRRLTEVAPQANEFLSLPYWVNVKKVSATPDRLSVVTSTTEDWTIRGHDPKSEFDGSDIVVTMLLSLYQVLHESRRAAPG